MPTVANLVVYQFKSVIHVQRIIAYDHFNSAHITFFITAHFYFNTAPLCCVKVLFSPWSEEISP